MVYIHRHSSILGLDLFDVGMVSAKAAHHTKYQHIVHFAAAEIPFADNLSMIQKVIIDKLSILLLIRGVSGCLAQKCQELSFAA